MESLKELYRTGTGPSSSHSMGPKRAAGIFLSRNSLAKSFRVTLYGSLAATGKGHLTDIVIEEVFKDHPVNIIWKPDQFLPMHPNGMEFEAMDESDKVISFWQVCSIGGGALRDSDRAESQGSIYKLKSMDEILSYVKSANKCLWEIVGESEGEDIWNFLNDVWHSMEAAIEKGISNEGFLPGDLKLRRKSKGYFDKVENAPLPMQRTCRLSAYALAVAEENAAGGQIVTAPTCGSCGVVPAVLKYYKEVNRSSDSEIVRALASAGLIGNLVKSNASISGAEVGCQGEIGTACAMAAAAAAQLSGGTPKQIEYAAEMAIEHNLGLTCDPVMGQVQIPCIERNAMAAIRALDCAEYALLSAGEHEISFDEAVLTMKETGKDLKNYYRETSMGGLAVNYDLSPKE
jgi:L-serine dehydratase